MLEQKVPINAADNQEGTALDLGLDNAYFAIVEVLQAKGARLNENGTLLHRIARNASLSDIVVLRDERGFDFMVVDGQDHLA